MDNQIYNSGDLVKRDLYSNERIPDLEKKNSIDDFIYQRTRILRTKLEVFASEIKERLNLRSRNSRKLDNDKTLVEKMVHPYQARSREERLALYLRGFEIKKEIRNQDVECWQDIVQVMKDFLNTWEAHEQAKAREAILSE